MANELFPAFLKLDKLNVLLIGGGKVANEKLNAILCNSPKTKIKLIAKEIICKELEQLILSNKNIHVKQKAYQKEELNNIHIVFSAVNDKALTEQIFIDTRKKNILLNAADKPDFCDFYLGAVVQKNNLKIAISTNGLSPTLAKRIKQSFQEIFPNNLEQVLQNMQNIRQKLKTDFEHKVKTLNNITKAWINSKQQF